MAGEDPTDDLVDICFDLAHTHHCHPALFLDMDTDELAFYVAATNRLVRRLKDN